MATQTTHQPRVWLLSHPRTGCHLLEKMLHAQPNTQYTEHLWFYDSYYHQSEMVGSKEDLDDCSAELMEKIKRSEEKSLRVYLDAAKEADEKNMILWTHEHPHVMVNPIDFFEQVHGTRSQKYKISDFLSETSVYSDRPERTSKFTVPDALLLDPRNRFIFSIRHPLLVVKSQFKLAKDLGMEVTKTIARSFCTYSWHRNFYDWSTSRGVKVYILDAVDYVVPDQSGKDGEQKPYLPSDTLKKLCEKVGFDPAAIQTTWEKADPATIRSDVERAAGKDINESEGVFKAPSRPVGMDIDEEKAKWMEVFGEKMAKLMSEIYDQMIDDYQYLWERRLTLS